MGRRMMIAPLLTGLWGGLMSKRKSLLPFAVAVSALVLVLLGRFLFDPHPAALVCYFVGTFIAGISVGMVFQKWGDNP